MEETRWMIQSINQILENMLPAMDRCTFPLTTGGTVEECPSELVAGHL